LSTRVPDRLTRQRIPPGWHTVTELRASNIELKQKNEKLQEEIRQLAGAFELRVGGLAHPRGARIAVQAFKPLAWPTSWPGDTVSACEPLERFQSRCSGVAAVGEVVGALVGLEGLGAEAQEAVQPRHRPLPRLA